MSILKYYYSYLSIFNYMCILKYFHSYIYLLLYILIHLVIYNIMIFLFGVVSYKVRPPRLVSYACLYTTYTALLRFENKVKTSPKYRTKVLISDEVRYKISYGKASKNSRNRVRLWHSTKQKLYFQQVQQQ